VSVEPTRLEPRQGQLDPAHTTVLPMPEPTFDRGILVVNGVDFDTSGSQIISCYADSVFWGIIRSPSGGFPGGLLDLPPQHAGAARLRAVPADTLKQFSAVVWVGNNYGCDAGRGATPLFTPTYCRAGTCC